jgi:adenylylsulfate kinase
MLETASYLLRKDSKRILLLDGRTFSRRYQIENVVNTANSLHQSWRILECVCSEEIAKRRLWDQSASGEHPAGNRNSHLYLEVKSRFESITLSKTVINTGQSLQVCIGQGLVALC